MTDSDAEWIDIDAIPDISPTKPGPNKPPPRPSTPSSVTERPRRFPWGGDGRPRRPMRPRRPFDEPERLPPNQTPSNNNTVVISVSVVSVLFLLAVVSLLLYLFVLRKKLRKVQRSYSESQFSIRVQDVAHLDVDDSSSLYVNTTDLQKLVSSIRVKNKQRPPPPAPMKSGEIIQGHSSLISKNLTSLNASKPPAALPSSITEGNWLQKANPSNKPNTSTNLLRAPSCDSVIYSNISTKHGISTSSLRRPTAPPPPTPSKSVELPDYTTPLGDSDGHSTRKRRDSQSQDIDNFYSVPLSQTMGLSSTPEKKEDIMHSAKVKPRTLTNQKPKNLSSLTNDADRLSTNDSKKPVLPLLKVNMRPIFSNQDSLSTPDTARTCLTDIDTPPTRSPEIMSVKEKRALLEKVLTDQAKK